MDEIQNQNNVCFNCNSHNIKYPKNGRGATVHTQGNSKDFFNSQGTIDWIATCNDCGNEMFIAIQYDYDIKSGFTVKSFDFLMDEMGNCGHSKTNNR